MQKILVINVNWLGDVIFSSPIFKALRENYPKAEITCLAPIRVKEILESIPFIDEIITFDERGTHRTLLSKFNMIRTLSKKKYDIAFILHKSFTRALLAYLSGIPVRVGYATKNRRRLLTHPIPEPAEPVHRSDYYINMFESFGVKFRDKKTFLSVSVEAKDKIDDLLSKNGIRREDYLLVVNPGGNWALKRWPADNFNKLLKKVSFYEGIKIVISGAPKDKLLAENISKGMNKKALIIAGEMSIKELIALMKRADLVLSADSGPLHLANALGTKTIAIFGPTNKNITGPKGSGEATILCKDIGCNRTPCYFLECANNLCMQAVNADEVYREIVRIRVGK